jgi:pilus assembly protein CpaF
MANVNVTLRTDTDYRNLAARINSDIIGTDYNSLDLPVAIEEWARRNRLALTSEARDKLASIIEDRRKGAGALTDLMNDDLVTDIAVNRYDSISVQRVGGNGWEPVVGLSFGSETELEALVRRLISRARRSIDSTNPVVDDARLPEGQRFFVSIKPASTTTVLIIRKFRRQVFTLAELATKQFQSLSPHMAGFLMTCVRTRLNLLVAGGTGSGKTTLLSTLLDSVPATERLVLIEDPPEIILPPAHIYSPRLVVDRDTPGLRAEDMLRYALRMTPDRIIVGEVRGGEAFTMLQAMNTGHEGSMSSIHANTPDDALTRLETLAIMGAPELPYRAIKAQIGSALHIIVQLRRSPRDGRRYVSEIAEVTWDGGDNLETRTLFEVRAGKFAPVNRPLLWERTLARHWPTDRPDPWVTSDPAKSSPT